MLSLKYASSSMDHIYHKHLLTIHIKSGMFSFKMFLPYILQPSNLSEERLEFFHVINVGALLGSWVCCCHSRPGLALPFRLVRLCRSALARMSPEQNKYYPLLPFTNNFLSTNIWTRPMIIIRKYTTAQDRLRMSF